jgi:hypothetical protein
MTSPEISPELEDLIINRLAETANRNKVGAGFSGRWFLWAKRHLAVDFSIETETVMIDSMEE